MYKYDSIDSLWLIEPLRQQLVVQDAMHSSTRPSFEVQMGMDDIREKGSESVWSYEGGIASFWSLQDRDQKKEEPEFFFWDRMRHFFPMS